MSYYVFGGDESFESLASEVFRILVWNQAEAIPGYDAQKWRKDAYGTWIKFSDYDDAESLYGWRIEYEPGLANIDAIEFEGLRPVQCFNAKHGRARH